MFKFNLFGRLMVVRLHWGGELGSLLDYKVSGAKGNVGRVRCGRMRNNQGEVKEEGT